MLLQTKMEVGEFELSFKADTIANQATLNLLDFEEGLSADFKLDNFSGTIQVRKLESKPSKKAAVTTPPAAKKKNTKKDYQAVTPVSKVTKEMKEMLSSPGITSPFKEQGGGMAVYDSETDDDLDEDFVETQL
jgi:hypothetical protein